MVGGVLLYIGALHFHVCACCHFICKEWSPNFQLLRILFSTIYQLTYTHTPHTHTHTHLQGASLSQLFVSFLETESLPSLPQTTPTAMPLNPPPPGRIPEPDPDRPSRATASLSLIHPSVPQNHPITGSTSVVQQSVSSNTDTPGSGTAPGPTTTHSPPLTASASLPSLTNPHLAPITQSTTSQGTSSHLSQTITGAPILTPQRTRHLHNHQPSILRDLLSPLPPTS